MRCPKCGHLEDKVIDSRTGREGRSVRRRRVCQGCGQRFTTVEEIIPAEITVCKRGGDRQDYNPAKIREGVKKALWKREYDEERLDAMLHRVNSAVEALGVREVESERIGEIVMEELQKFDEIAYVRFASVYREFRDARDLLDAMEDTFRLDPTPPAKKPRQRRRKPAP